MEGNNEAPLSTVSSSKELDTQLSHLVLDSTSVTHLV